MCSGSGTFPRASQSESEEHVYPLRCARPAQGDHCLSLGGCISGPCGLGDQPGTITGRARGAAALSRASSSRTALFSAMKQLLSGHVIGNLKLHGGEWGGVFGVRGLAVT